MWFSAPSVDRDCQGPSFSSNNMSKYRLKNSVWHSYCFQNQHSEFASCSFFNRSITYLRFTVTSSMLYNCVASAWKALETLWSGVRAVSLLILTCCGLRADWKASSSQGVEALVVLLMGWNRGSAQPFPVLCGSCYRAKGCQLAASCIEFFQALFHKVTAC